MLFQGRLCALVGTTSRLSTVALRSATELRPASLMGLKAQTHVLPAMAFIQFRNVHSLKLSRGIEFFPASSDLPLPKNSIQKLILKLIEDTVLCKAFRQKFGFSQTSLGPAYAEQSRPMTLLFCWLMSKEKHIRKYADLYNNMGFDVLKVRVTPYDLLRPTKGSQIVVEQVLQFLNANPSQNPLLIHGFSVGAYVFTELLVKVEKEFDKHGHLLDRMVGQIWDSPVDLEGIPFGTSRAITNNVTIQNSIQKYLEWYLKVRYNTSTIHYERASAKMHQNYVGAPGLFFISENDPVATPKMVAKVYNKWEGNGHEVFVKCWDKSRHVSHYRMYQKEYEDHVIAFLERIRLLESARRAASL
ncbi:transmembrane protein 53-B-like isoform X1 [Palaemon carinicauda]|uniref:transmembrane protein 53-B-like isoform X1 n=1 Tax=Palaemon carinicauda TaxID=392227 RepID=UPI0035B5E719